MTTQRRYLGLHLGIPQVLLPILLQFVLVFLLLGVSTDGAQDGKAEVIANEEGGLLVTGGWMLMGWEADERH